MTAGRRSAPAGRRASERPGSEGLEAGGQKGAGGGRSCQLMTMWGETEHPTRGASRAHQEPELLYHVLLDEFLLGFLDRAIRF